MTRSHSWLFVLAATAAGVGGCTSRHPGEYALHERTHSAATGGGPQHRDIDEMMRAKFEPRSCAEDDECPFGTYCNDTGACDYQCVSDDACGTGMACTDHGQCWLSFKPFSDITGPECAGQDHAAIVAALEDLFHGDDPPKCHVDSDCICGAYCNTDSGFCQVDCVDGSTSGDLVCTDPELSQCNHFGRCTSATDTGPSAELVLAMTPSLASGDTYGAPAVVPITVSVDALTPDVAASPPAADVRYHFVGIDDPQRPASADDPPPDPAAQPQIKCAEGDALATSCTIHGGWTFDAQTLHSATKTVWVQLPQSTVGQTWTLQATSEWAADPMAISVMAAPVTPPPPPAQVPGHYQGTLTMTLGGGSVLAHVDALITDASVAVLDPARTFLPDGHAVFSRDAGKATLLGWLGTGTSHYDVLVHLGVLAQGDVAGHVEFPASTVAIGGALPAPLTLVLDRTGDLDAAVCATAADCTAATYCDAAFGRCLPGSAPATGGGIVAATSAPSLTLPSSQIAAWAPQLAALSGQHPGTLHPGVTGIESAYCAHDTGDTAPPKFNSTPTIAGAPGNAGASLDTECTLGGPDYMQPTFPFADRTTELTQAAQGGSDFSLIDTCAAELGATPSSTFAPAACVSPARFFLALAANVTNGIGISGGHAQQRLVWQVLRQWLGLTTYMASTNVRLQPYSDILGATSVPRNVRLGQAVDQMEQNLLVLLDPTVRSQFAEGSALTDVVTAPDYRVRPHPVARWSFNNLGLGSITSVAVPDVEGSNALQLTYSGDSNGRIDLSNNSLQSSGFGGTRTCVTSSPVALDDGTYSISAALRFVPWNGQTVTLVDKQAGTQHLKLDATTGDFGAHVTLTLYNPGGGAATFVVPWLPANWDVGATMLAVVADGGSYRAYFANQAPGMAPTLVVPSSVTGGGPRWGAPGQVTFACQAPGAAACWSYDHMFPGDRADIASTTQMQFAGGGHYWCTSTKFGHSCHGPAPAPERCTDTTPSSTIGQAYTNNRNSLLAAGVPQALIDPIHITGTLETLDSGTDTSEPGQVSTWIDWDCALTLTNYPTQVYNFKPACGPGGTWTQWDDLALWSHPLSLEQFSAMVAKYGYNAANQTTPLPATITLDPASEQAVGLPVSLVEAANAQLDLLAHYVAAADDAVYADCYANRASTEQPIATARAGRNLRLISVLRSEAVRLAALAGNGATWLPRYQTDLQQLATRFAEIQTQLSRLATCKNTLNISDAEIPLYVGEGRNTSPTARFFAGSDYLVGLAEAEVLSGPLSAANLKDQARASYIAQRLSAFQTQLGAAQKQDRVNAISVTYEDQLKKYCGAAPGDLTGGHPLLDGFVAGTLDSTRCFLKLEDTTHCAHDLKGRVLDGTTPFADIPDGCMRGEMGERVIAVKSAAIDAANALAQRDRAQASWDQQVTFCAKMKESHFDASLELADHVKTMRRLDKVREDDQQFAALGGAIANVGSTTGKGGITALVLTFPALFMSLGGTLGSAEDEQRIADENLAYLQEVADRLGSEQDLACDHTADEQRFAIAAADDTIKHAAEASVAAAFALSDDLNTVDGIGGEARSQLALENTINRTPPQFHYWLDQNIADYEKHMAYARRLTYLALRAYEYEAQVDTSKRGQVLTARVPQDLEDVITFIKNRSAPFAGGGIDPKSFSNVFSLRDEIMKLKAVPGKTVGQVFNDLLFANPVYVGTGPARHLLGYGIPFTLSPGESWNDVMCDERIWRITPLVTVTGGPPTDKTVVLYQSNTFGSQACTATHPVQMTRIQQNANLLSGDELPGFATPDPSFSTPIFLNLSNSSSDESLLANLPDTDARLDPSMAGRGLYGDYELVIPLCDPSKGCTTGYTLDKLHNVTDVNVRLDVASGANTQPISR